MAAAASMLSDVHPSLPISSNDHNTYTLGRVSDHNVVIACLPFGVYGTTSAATVASQMLSSFPSIRFVLMVGIGGGAPSETADIRLGDVVVSKPNRGFSGVIQYDYGKTIAEGRFERTGMLNKPPQVLLTAIAKLQARHMEGHNLMTDYISGRRARSRSPSFAYPGGVHDVLFQSNYKHATSADGCHFCDPKKAVYREPRPDRSPAIHYGLIASGNQVVKDSHMRDRFSKEMGILCFEMEAAGLMDGFACLVIRGICDYADSHKNKRWQPYAAATAAAYAKELLSIVAANEEHSAPSISSIEEGK
jgi:nucleoside phosphorylase